MLDGMLVENVRNALSGGVVDWLAPDDATEFTITAEPDNFEIVWKSCQAMEVDLILQRDIHRHKKLLLADMDSTMITQECIDDWLMLRVLAKPSKPSHFER